MAKFFNWLLTIGMSFCTVAMIYMAYMMAKVSQVGMFCMFIFLTVLFALATYIFYDILIKGGR